MFVLNDYLHELIEGCRSAFGRRLLYLGLQGSYLRGEANERSDIDIMTVIDGMTAADMDAYRGILEHIGYFEKSCGFICGREELARWNPLEVCQLLHTTKDLFGTLKDLLPPASRADEVNYVKLSLGNLYHEICHRYIHADREKNISKFSGTCKGLFFLMQNLHYLESGEFALAKKELMERVSEEDRRVLNLAEAGNGFDFDEAFAALFAWCQRAFARVDEAGRKAPDSLRIEKVDRGAPLAAELLDFVQNCSWVEVREHIAQGIRAWEFTDWETMFAAIADGKIVGMASVMKTDYYPLPDVFPWVSSIFVSEAYRGRKISGALIARANEYLKGQGFRRSYIPTEHMGLYERYGYRYLRDIVNYGGGVDHLFVKEFDAETEEIITERLVLRKFRESDYDDLFEFLSQLRDNEFEGYPDITYENGREHLAYRLGSEEFYAVALKATGKVIGNVYCGKRDFNAREIGYIVNEQYRRKGYALEALKAVIEHAFRSGVHRVFAECDPRNECSWRLLEKAGLTREAHFRRNIYFRKDSQGKPVWKDTYVYAGLNGKTG